MPLLKGDANYKRGEAILYQSNQGYVSVRQDDWVFITQPASYGLSIKPKDIDQPDKIDDAPFQLYNLKDDIKQLNNLYYKLPEKSAEVKALCRKLINDGRSTKGKKQQNDAPYSDYGKWKQIVF